MITIILNGDKKSVPENMTAAQLFDHLKLDKTRVALEQNREIVTKSSYDQTQINDGDVLEVVQFIGGG